MDDLDYSQLLQATDEPTYQQKAAAMADALRRRRGVGELSSLIGGPAAGFGKALLDSTGQGQAELAQAPQQRQQMALRQQALGKGRVEEEQRKRLESPNSPGTLLRMAALKAGMPGISIPQGTTGSDVSDQLLQVVERAQAAKEASDARRFAVTERRNALSDHEQARKDKASEKEREEFDKEMAALGKDTDPGQARAGIKGNLLQALNRADAFKTLAVGPNGEIANLTPQQMPEAAMSLANLISQGQATEGLVHSLVPETMESNWANLKQKIFNEPMGAESQAFLKNMVDTASREAKVARRQLQQIQAGALTRHGSLAKRYPEEFKNAIRSQGLDPSRLDMNTLLYSFPDESGQLPTIKDKAGYDALPPGAQYLDPNGVHRKKGG